METKLHNSVKDRARSGGVYRILPRFSAASVMGRTLRRLPHVRGKDKQGSRRDTYKTDDILGASQLGNHRSVARHIRGHHSARSRTRICARDHVYIYRAQPAENRRGEPPSIRRGEVAIFVKFSI